MTIIKPIAIIAGDDGGHIQDLLAVFVAQQRDNWRLAGAIETGRVESLGQKSVLSNIISGRTYPIFDNLGAAAQGCALRADGLVQASQDVCDQIAEGCDLVLLSKFGKLEAEERSGLIAAFAGAMMADLPILTSVSSRYAEAWARFAAPYFTTLPAEIDAITGWWDAICTRHDLRRSSRDLPLESWYAA